MGDSGSSRVDVVARMAIMVLVGLLICHCFMWFVEFGGSVTVE